MKMRSIKVLCLAGLGTLTLAACTSLFKGEPDPRWADYKSWTKITDGKPATGDPTGFVGGVHNGREGFRDVYVNDIGKDAMLGSAPYVFPVGTVIVKEQFRNKTAWENQSKPGFTASIKKTAGSGSADNWEWADSYTDKAGPSAFCSGCHTIAVKDDFAFTTGDFLSQY